MPEASRVPTPLVVIALILPLVVVVLCPVKHNRLPSLELARYPVELALPDVRRAEEPVVPLMAVVVTGDAWLAAEGLNSMILKLVLLALADSARKRTRLPSVNWALRPDKGRKEISRSQKEANRKNILIAVRFAAKIYPADDENVTVMLPLY